jgi:hypothetical protein
LRPRRTARIEIIIHTRGPPPEAVPAPMYANFLIIYKVDGQAHSHFPDIWRGMRLGQRGAFAMFVRCLSRLFTPEGGEMDVKLEIGTRLPAMIDGIVRRLAAALLLNALRHGYGPGCGGQVHISVARTSSEMIKLSVVDDGGGVIKLSPGRGHRLRLRLCGLGGGDLRIWLPEGGGYGVDGLLSLQGVVSSSSAPKM